LVELSARRTRSQTAAAAAEFRWQYVFPSAKISIDPRSGEKRRHHAYEAAVSRAVTEAVRRAKITKRATVFGIRSPRT
jgi:hypothetical protein